MADIRRFANDISAKAVSSGTDTVTLTTETVHTAYVDGLMVGFIAGGTNTGAATLNVDGVGAKAIRKNADAALSAGDITAGQVVVVVYDASANSAAGAWLIVGRIGVASGSIVVSDLAGSAVIVESEGIASNDNDTSFPTSAAVKDYVDTVAILKTLLTTRGDIIYRDASAPARLAKGTSGQVLTMGANDPAWATPTSGLAAASVAEIHTGTAEDKAITPGIWMDALANVALTSGATVTVDFQAGINFSLALAEAATLAASNHGNVIGRTGKITVTETGGTRTLDMTGSPFVNVNSQNLAIGTGSGDKHVIYYDIVSATEILLSMARDIG